MKLLNLKGRFCFPSLINVQHKSRNEKSIPPWGIMCRQHEELNMKKVFLFFNISIITCLTIHIKRKHPKSPCENPGKIPSI